MVIKVDYTKAIEEMAEQLKGHIVQNTILKAQLDAVSTELNSLLETIENYNLQKTEEADNVVYEQEIIEDSVDMGD